MPEMSCRPAPEQLMKSVSVSEDEITAVLTYGRRISVPLAWWWRLSEATPEQRAIFDTRNVTGYNLIRTFKTAGTRDIFEGRSSKQARRCLPAGLWPRALLKLDELDAATDLRQLRLPSNRLEKLAGDRSGEHSIRINRQYRICFRWSDADAWDVEITDYH